MNNGGLSEVKVLETFGNVEHELELKNGKCGPVSEPVKLEYQVRQSD